MESLFKTQLPWWEFIARGLLVYFLVLVLLRITGKRQIGQLSPFDFVLLLILSNGVQNAMNGGDNSFTGGAILASTLVGINSVTGYVTYYWPWMERLVEGSPRIVIYDGHARLEAMAAEKLTMQELLSALRQEGCTEISQVRLSIIEPNVRITVIARKESP